jgi:PPK2 family polyphosphate:nucleotide phosphotransferase
MKLKRYRIAPGSKVKLSRFDPAGTAGVKKSGAEAVFPALNERLEAFQERLWAEHKHKVLVVLQGMDTSGKDGVIRKVFEGVNPQGVRVAAFKAPTEEDLDHDFLWRVHAQVPGRGELAIFNRSHYEDVLVPRVRRLVPEKVWRARYDQINDFERLLAETGTTILKFFLHISKDEQRARLQERLDNPEKRWKFRKGDLDDRALWDDYMAAYEALLSRTSTRDAPWFVVPADKKWYRDLIIAKVIDETLKKLDIRLPEPEEDLTGIVIE